MNDREQQIQNFSNWINEEVEKLSTSSPIYIITETTNHNELTTDAVKVYNDKEEAKKFLNVLYESTTRSKWKFIKEKELFEDHYYIKYITGYDELVKILECDYIR